MAAAGSFVPVSRQPGLDHTWSGKPQGDLVGVRVGLVGGDKGREVGLGVGGQRRDSGGSVAGSVTRGVELGSLNRRQVERRFAHANETTKSRHERAVRRRRASAYGGDASGRTMRRGTRVARAGWGRKAVGAPPNAPALAAWSTWGLGIRAGPTT
jgi:hypothetical protein